MAEARALKLCTKGDYIKSGQRDDKSPLKGRGFAHVTRFFVCTAVELENILLATRRAAINNVSLTDCCISQYGALEAMHVAR